MSDFFTKIKKTETPYFIAEVGINHNGDMNITKKLIDATNACSWDCVKFQKRNPDVCVPEHQKSIMRDTPWGRMTYLNYKYKVEFEKKEYDEINDYCSSKPLPWTVSVWDIDSLNFIKNYDVPFIKIPSAHLNNLELIEESSKTGIPILLSTGMSTWTMIDAAVSIIEKNKSDYGILHCNSTYPAPNEELNLNVIPKMIEKYNCVIGYSGHEYDLEPSVIAISLGAKIIERHITLDHNMWGTDHNSSLEVHAMDLLRKRGLEINNMLGSNNKIITKSEEEVMKKLRG